MSSVSFSMQEFKLINTDIITELKL